MTGVNSNKHHHLCCSGFEIYGHVKYDTGNGHGTTTIHDRTYDKNEGLQPFEIEMVSTQSVGGRLKEGDYTFEAVHSNKAIDIDHKVHYNKVGASLVQMDAAEDMFGYGNNQTFHIKPHESKYYTIQCKNSCLYWSILGSSQKHNAKLIQNNFCGQDNQLFEFVHCVENKYLIKGKHSNKYISIKDGSTATGSKVVQSDRNYQFVCKMLQM